MPSYAKWYIEAHDQLLKFPYGAHDDFADALAYIGLGLAIMVKHHPAKAQAKGPAQGTLGWVKAQSRAQDNARKVRYGGF
jgi:hypothetical protein